MPIGKREIDNWLCKKLTSHIQQRYEDMRCAICSRKHDNPKFLSCFHSFCLACLEKLSIVRKSINSRIVQCPECGRRTMLLPKAKNGLQDLGSNFKLVSMKAEKADNVPARAESSRAVRRVGAVVCDVCVDDAAGVAATVCCAECKQNMCPSCSRVHGRLAACKDHRVQDVVSENGSTDVDADRVVCRGHPTVTPEFVCEQCVDVQCATCFVENHNGHPFCDYDMYCDMLRHQLKACVRRIREFAVDYKLKVLVQLHTSYAAKTNYVSGGDAGLNGNAAEQASGSKVGRVWINPMLDHEQNWCGENCRKLPILDGFVAYCEEVVISGSNGRVYRSYNDLYRTASNLELYENIKSANEWAVPYSSSSNDEAKSQDVVAKNGAANTAAKTESSKASSGEEPSAGSSNDARNNGADSAFGTKNNHQSLEAISKDAVGGVRAADDGSKRHSITNGNDETVVATPEVVLNAANVSPSKENGAVDTAAKTESSKENDKQRVDTKKTAVALRAKLYHELPDSYKSRSVAVLADALVVLDLAGPKLDVFDKRTFDHWREFDIARSFGNASNLCVVAASQPNDDFLFVAGVKPNIVCRIAVKPRTDFLIMKYKTSWTHSGGMMVDVSATPSGNVLVADGTQSLWEYDPDGLRIRVVTIADQCGCNMVRAELLPDGRFVAMHFNYTDWCHRLLKLDPAGHLLTAYSIPCSDTMLSTARCMAVSRAGFVLVADHVDDHMMFFDSDLECVSYDVVCRENYPTVNTVQMCWDDTGHMLYACEAGGMVKIFTLF